jgi:hypothetical protein
LATKNSVLSPAAKYLQEAGPCALPDQGAMPAPERRRNGKNRRKNGGFCRLIAG